MSFVFYRLTKGFDIGPKSKEALLNMIEKKVNFRVDLSSLNLDEEFMVTMAQRMHKSSVRTLGLNYDILSDKSVQALSKMLRVNTTLEELILLGNRLNTKHIQAIAESLRINQTLKGLIIRSKIYI